MKKGIKYNQDHFEHNATVLELNFRHNAVVLRVTLKSIMLKFSSITAYLTLNIVGENSSGLSRICLKLMTRLCKAEPQIVGIILHFNQIESFAYLLNTK